MPHCEVDVHFPGISVALGMAFLFGVLPFQYREAGEYGATPAESNRLLLIRGTRSFWICTLGCGDTDIISIPPVLGASSSDVVFEVVVSLLLLVPLLSLL